MYQVTMVLVFQCYIQDLLCFFSEIVCPGLDDPANGEVTVNGVTPGDTATYSCNTGYNLVGAETVTCGDDGAWSADPPMCTREFKIFVLCY